MCDEDEVLMWYYYVLKKCGFEVQRARDGTEAISRFVEDWPHIVILESNLPKCWGAEVASEIHAMRPSTRIIMIIGDEIILEDPQRIGVDVILKRPVSRSDLSNSVLALASLREPMSIVAR